MPKNLFSQNFRYLCGFHINKEINSFTAIHFRFLRQSHVAPNWVNAKSIRTSLQTIEYIIYPLTEFSKHYRRLWWYNENALLFTTCLSADVLRKYKRAIPFVSQYNMRVSSWIASSKLGSNTRLLNIYEICLLIDVI